MNSNDSFNVSDIKPFFQTVIYKNENFNFKKFNYQLSEQIRETNNKGKRNIKLLDTRVKYKCFTYQLSLKEKPTWYKKDCTINGSHINIEKYLNRELILLIIRVTKNYIFIHCTNNIINDSISEIFIKKFKIRKIDICSVYSVLDDDEVQVRTLGLHNTFAAGGSAPEAKTYFGKEMQNSLSISFDSGYSFSYCLATKQKEDKKKTSIGCSTRKRKVWGTWTDGIMDYSKQCEKLALQLNSNSDTDIFPVLVKPVNGVDITKLEIINFYIDYVIPKKGLVFIEIDKTLYLDWNVTYRSNNNIVLEVEKTEIEVELVYSNNMYSLKYKNSGEKAFILLSENEDETKGKRKKELLEYLNENNIYTIIFTDGYAYRDDTFWKDNRIALPYKNVLTDINWSNVDITTESGTTQKKGMINISDNVLNHLISNISDILFIIDDDNANEVADHIVVTKTNIILIHEKFSSSEKIGIRVDDVQVVVAQSLKNIRFFIPTSYDKKGKRLLKNIVYPKTHQFTEENVIKSIKNSITNIEDSNECWIVQPGLEKSKLMKQKDNKIHTLLNYVDGICKNNNIKFNFYGS